VGELAAQAFHQSGMVNIVEELSDISPPDIAACVFSQQALRPGQAFVQALADAAGPDVRVEAFVELV
jgi:hypothetical protein